MEKQNVTLSLPKETLRKARLLAVERNRSLSSLLVEAIEEIVAKSDAYELAREQHLAILKEGYNLGTYGNITSSREDLHER